MKNGSADKRRNVGSGAQWRIENGTQTCIVPAATSGIVKYDRLLVKWDENIGCRACLSLAPVPPAAFSTPAPLRDNTGRSPVKWPCRFAFSGNPACYDLRDQTIAWSRSNSRPTQSRCPLGFSLSEECAFREPTCCFCPVSRAASWFWFPYSWRVVPFDRGESYHVSLQFSARSSPEDSW